MGKWQYVQRPTWLSSKSLSEKKEGAWLWLANGKHTAFNSRSLVHIQNQNTVATAEMLLSEDQSMAYIE